jgi:hypothetical protein
MHSIPEIAKLCPVGLLPYYEKELPSPLHDPRGLQRFMKIPLVVSCERNVHTRDLSCLVKPSSRRPTPRHFQAVNGLDPWEDEACLFENPRFFPERYSIVTRLLHFYWRTTCMYSLRFVT